MRALSSATSTTSSCDAGWHATGLPDAQRREVERLADASRELRVVLEQILAVADELATGTIERQMSKSDIELGLEHLRRARP